MKKLLPKLYLLLFLSFLFFLSRIQNLLTIPVFADEAIYLRWSQIIANVETLRFLPLTDGKQPLYMWILVVFYKFFNDPLYAGRILSIISGYFSMLLIGISSAVLLDFKHKSKNPLIFTLKSINHHPLTVAFSMLVYLLLPITFFFDRLALPDNLLSMFGVLSFLLSILLAKFRRLDLAMLLGASLGFAWLTKSPAIYYVVLSVLTFLLLNLRKFSQTYLSLISAAIGFFIYNLLRLGPQFHMIAIRNRDYLWTLPDIIKHPLDPLLPHISDIITIYLQYISIPVLIIAFTGLVLGLWSKHLKNYPLLFVVFIWWFLPLLANSLFAKVFTARYILFTTPAFILLLVLGFQAFVHNTTKIFASRISQVLLIIIAFSFNVFWMYRISTNPFNSSLPSTEMGYIRDWTSGWGISPAANYLIDRSREENIIVGTEGYFGTLPDGLQIYTQNIPQLTVFGVGLDLTQVPEKLVDAKNHGDEVYLLFNRSRLKLTPEEQNKVEIIKSFPKPGEDELNLYRLK